MSGNVPATESRVESDVSPYPDGTSHSHPDGTRADPPTRSRSLSGRLSSLPRDLQARTVGDRSAAFTLALAGAWVICVALPLATSVLLARPFRGLPLLGPAIWLALLRGARWVSPPARCDRLLQRGRYAEAAALCEGELSLRGPSAWHGNRRLAWLNRLTSALLGAGRLGEASVAALEALAERPDPETLANLAQCLLVLNRYQEAAEAARMALSLTRNRSVSAHAVLANVLMAEGRPAEAQAMAQSGMADIEALLPYVQPAHHVALLAALCRADRALSDDERARVHLAALRKAAGHNPLLQAYMLLEEADARASWGDVDGAFGLLEQASQLAPHLACWFVQQPYTLDELMGDPQLPDLVDRAHSEWVRRAGADSARLAPDQGAAPPAYVAMELAGAQQRASIRPAPHASWQALVVQVTTVGATLALLVWWTWTFFLSGA
jgi:tetratricopeptide (TPR) repeat protein